MPRRTAIPRRTLRWGAALLAAVGATALLPAPAPGRDLPDALDDRLGLIAFSEPIRERTLGRATWEVWACDAGGPLRIAPRTVAALLNLRLAPYFAWMSDGAYTPAFTAGGTVSAPRPGACPERAAAAGRDPSRPALIVDDRSGAAGSGSPGSFSSGGGGIEWTEAPTAAVNGGAVASLFNSSQPTLGAAARAMARALGFPFSSGGGSSGGGTNGYDHPMDVMSGAVGPDLTVGTIAVNRYAAGWFGVGETAVHRSGAAAYQLSPAGEDGFQMLAVPSRDGPGVFYALGARVRSGFDRGVPKEGVEVYRVDQRESACAAPAAGACWGGERRTQQFPAGDASGLVRHVHRVGTVFELEGTRVEVTSRRGDRFTVRVGTPGPGETVRLVCAARFAGRFCDEDGSLHERAIEKAAEWGITVGCGGDRFCPGETITRRQMAAFLHRAARWTYGRLEDPAGQASLTDVPFNAWYRPFAEWAVETQVMAAPFGAFQPDRLVTRGEMAEMLTAAFEHLSNPAAAQGLFTDMVNSPVRTVNAAEALYEAGVAKGCSTHPRQFCPDRPVTRAQMASFFVRALET